VLKRGASGVIWDTDLEGVTGSGTLNYLAKWTPDNSTLGNSQLFDNGTNVGVGTAAPAYKMHVIGDVYANGGWLRSSGSTGWFNQTHSGGWYMTDATWIRTYNNKSIYQNVGIMRTDGTLQVGNAGSTLNVVNDGDLSYRTSVLFANTTGNVGIGTASPEQALHVSGNIQQNNSDLLMTKNAAGTNQTWMWPRWSDNVMYTNFGENGWNIRNNASTNVMFMTNAGNVGIATTAPSQRLDVNGNLRLRGHIYDSANSAGAVNQVLKRGASGVVWGTDEQGVTGSGVATRVAFWTGTTALGSNANLYWDNTNSRLGIGTSTPSNRITIEGVSGGTGFSASDGTGGLRVRWSSGYGVGLDAWDGGTPRWGITKYSGDTPMVMMEGRYNSSDVIFNAGNVGIGTTAPVQRLDVTGQIRTSTGTFRTPSTVYSYLNDGGAAVPGRYLGLQVSSSYSGTIPNNGILFYTDTNLYRSAATTLRTNGTLIVDGNVGIATTAPSQRLDINGNLRLRGHIYDSANSAGAVNQVLKRGASGVVWGTDEGVTGSGTLNYVAKWTPDGTTLGDSQLFDDGTNVGIGTTAPAAKLEINQSGMGLYLNQPAAGDLYMRYHVPGVRWWTVGAKANGDFWFSNASNLSTAGPLTLTNGGNVGIGTSTPGYTLHVNGNAYATSMLAHTPGGSWLSGKTGTAGFNAGTAQTSASYHPMLRQTTSSGHVVSLGGLGDNFGFYGYDAARTVNGVDYHMTMNLANGNVYMSHRLGIGTSAPGASLEVRGTTKLANASNLYHSWFPFTDNNSYVSGENLIFRTTTADTERMRITSGGYRRDRDGRARDTDWMSPEMDVLLRHSTHGR
jgi:hypothetical protein